MRVRNPEQVSGDRTFKIFIAILFLIIFCKIFFHGGTAVLRDTRQEGPFLFLLLSDGHVYEASLCKYAGSSSGNQIRFAAIGFDLSLFGERISAPVIINCEFTGWWVDDFALPPP